MTDSDLIKQLGEVVDTKLAKRLKPIEERLKPIEERLSGLEIRFEGIETKMTGLEKQQKKTNKILKQVVHDIAYMSKNFDQEIVTTRRRVEKIEDHLGIRQPQ